MHSILSNIKLLLLCSIIWMIMNEGFSIFHFLTGLFLGTIALFITKEYLLLYDYKKVYPISIFSSIKYFFFLLFQIYWAGLLIIPKIISGKINPNIVEIESNLNNDFLNCILANSITLTPGTVTVDKKGKKLKILWLNNTTTNSEEAGKIIKGKFEKFLLKG